MQQNYNYVLWVYNWMFCSQNFGFSRVTFHAFIYKIYKLYNNIIYFLLMLCNLVWIKNIYDRIYEKNSHRLNDGICISKDLFGFYFTPIWIVSEHCWLKINLGIFSGIYELNCIFPFYKMHKFEKWWNFQEFCFSIICIQIA